MITLGTLLSFVLAAVCILALTVIVSGEFARRLRAEFEQKTEELKVRIEHKAAVTEEHLLQVSRGLDKVEWEVMELATKQRVDTDGLKSELTHLREIIDNRLVPSRQAKGRGKESGGGASKAGRPPAGRGDPSALGISG